MSEQITGEGLVQETQEDVASLAARIMKSSLFPGIDEERAHVLASLCLKRRATPFDYFSALTYGGGEEVVYSVKKSKGVRNE